MNWKGLQHCLGYRWLSGLVDSNKANQCKALTQADLFQNCQTHFYKDLDKRFGKQEVTPALKTDLM